jgi:hypothetical protein
MCWCVITATRDLTRNRAAIVNILTQPTELVNYFGIAKPQKCFYAIKTQLFLGR